jgi:hypothetical protein
MSAHAHHKPRKLKTIGRREFVQLPLLCSAPIEAKVDTGAFRTVLHCLSCRTIDEGDKQILEAVFDLDGSGAKTYYFDHFVQRQVRSSFGEVEMRYCIRTVIKIGRLRIRTEVSLTDRSDMRYQVLIGRKTLNKKFKVDVSRLNTLGKHPHAD